MYFPSQVDIWPNVWPARSVNMGLIIEVRTIWKMSAKAYLSEQYVAVPNSENSVAST